MDLTPDQQRVVARWINDTIGRDPQCGTCGGDAWTAGAVVVPPVINEQGHTRMTNRGMTEHRAFVPYTCARCGTTIFFDAERVGLRIMP